MRNNPPKELGGHAVTRMLDYNSLSALDTNTGERASIACIKGNVVALEFGDSHCRATIRPSGTEPKLKVYIQWYEDANERSAVDLVGVRDEILNQLEGFAGQMSEQFIN